MNSDTFKGTAKKIEGSIESAYGSASGDRTSKAEGEAKITKGKVLNVFGKIEDKVSDFMSTASDEAESLKTQIRQKPVPSAVIALGIGFLVGKLFG